MICLQSNFRFSEDGRWNMKEAPLTWFMYETQEAPGLWETIHEAFPFINLEYRILDICFMQSCTWKAEPFIWFWNFPVYCCVRTERAFVFDQFTMLVEPSDEIVAWHFSSFFEIKKPRQTQPSVFGAKLAGGSTEFPALAITGIGWRIRGRGFFCEGLGWRT